MKKLKWINQLVSFGFYAIGVIISAASVSAQALNFSYQPNPGDTWKVTVHSVNKEFTSGNIKEKNITITCDLGCELMVIESDKNSFTVRAKINHIALEMTAPGEESLTVDSRSPRVNTENELRAIHHMVNKWLFFKVINQGDSCKTLGGAYLREQVMDLMPYGLDESQQNTYAGILGIILGEKGPFTSLGRVLKKEIKGSHSPGETWSVTLSKDLKSLESVPLQLSFVKMAGKEAEVSYSRVTDDLEKIAELKSEGLTPKKLEYNANGNIIWDSERNFFKSVNYESSTMLECIGNEGKFRLTETGTGNVEFVFSGNQPVPDWKESEALHCFSIRPNIRFTTPLSLWENINNHSSDKFLSDEFSFKPAKEYEASLLFFGAPLWYLTEGKPEVSGDTLNLIKNYFSNRFKSVHSEIQEIKSEYPGFRLFSAPKSMDSTVIFGFQMNGNAFMNGFRLCMKNPDKKDLLLSRIISGVDVQDKYFPGFDEYFPKAEEVKILTETAEASFPLDDYLNAISSDVFATQWKDIPESGLSLLKYAMNNGFLKHTYDASPSVDKIIDRNLKGIKIGESQFVYANGVEENGVVHFAAFRNKSGKWKRFSTVLPEKSFFGELSGFTYNSEFIPIIRAAGYRFYIGTPGVDNNKFTLLTENLDYAPYDCRCWLPEVVENKYIQCSGGLATRSSNPEEAQNSYDGFSGVTHTTIAANKRVYLSGLKAEVLGENRLVIFQLAFSGGKVIYKSAVELMDGTWKPIRDFSEIEELDPYKEMVKIYSRLSLLALPAYKPEN